MKKFCREVFVVTRSWNIDYMCYNRISAIDSPGANNVYMEI